MSVAAADPTAAPGRKRRRVLATLLVISAALNLFFVAGALWTHLHARAGWAGPEQRYQKMAAELDLDPQQRIGFDKYVAAIRGRTEKMHLQVTPLIGAAWEEIGRPQADGAQVLRLFDEAADKRREFQHEAMTKTLELLALLTPPQREKFVAIARERRGAWPRPVPAKR